ncbi:Small ubiquitinrelated modifier [Elasticomyces elasticus]|nr:Small ubiquitinrelated modifier [Elasticomyces elasticus]
MEPYQDEQDCFFSSTTPATTSSIPAYATSPPRPLHEARPSPRLSSAHESSLVAQARGRDLPSSVSGSVLDTASTSLAPDVDLPPSRHGSTSPAQEDPPVAGVIINITFSDHDDDQQTVFKMKDTTELGKAMNAWYKKTKVQDGVRFKYRGFDLTEMVRPKDVGTVDGEVITVQHETTKLVFRDRVLDGYASIEVYTRREDPLNVSLASALDHFASEYPWRESKIDTTFVAAHDSWLAKHRSPFELDLATGTEVELYRLGITIETRLI